MSPIQHNPIVWQLGLLGALAVSLSACDHNKTNGNGQTDPALPKVSYEELAAKYNARIEPITTYRVSSVVEIRWVDEDGKKHFEQGEGLLVIRRPSEMALTIGKLGNPHFWLGSDAERYWLFDLGDKPRLAYVGKQASIANVKRRVLPLPIRPDQLIGLIGLRPMPETHAATVEVDSKLYRVTLPPDQALGKLQPRIWVDAQHRPHRIQLLDAKQRVLVDAKLGSFARMRRANQPPGAWPWMPQRVELSLGDGDATVTLFIRKPTDGAGKIKDVQFDFDRLRRAHKIEDANVIDLDRDPPARR
jgi:hypothetical protein